jgi:hypothetical protein
MKRKTEFNKEEIQTALNNLNKGVQFVSVVEVVQKTIAAGVNA